MLQNFYRECISSSVQYLGADADGMQGAERWTLVGTLVPVEDTQVSDCSTTSLPGLAASGNVGRENCLTRQESECDGPSRAAVLQHSSASRRSVEAVLRRGAGGIYYVDWLGLGLD